MRIDPSPEKTIRPGPQACAAIANTMIGHFVVRLTAEARRSGGTLSVEDIEDAAARFLATDTERFHHVLERSWRECGQARDSAAWDHARNQPFDRVLVRRFAHLFPARSGDDGGHQPVLSRRMIPGCRLALSMMLGPELHEQCQRKAQVIVDRLRDDSGTADWTRVHSDPELRALVDDVLVVVAHHFTNFEKRCDWFVTLVNTHLRRAEPGAPDAHWQLTPDLFYTMMLALFDDLFRGLGQDGGASLRQRYGDGACDVLRAFMKHLGTLR